MKNKTKSIVFFIVAVVLPFLGNAQSKNSNLDSIKKTYARMKNYAMEVTYKLYKSYDATEFSETASASMKKKDEQYYYKIADAESLVNENYIMMVSHKRKTLMIDHYVKPSKKSNKPIKHSGIDSLLSKLVEKLHSADSTSTHLSEKAITLTEKQITLTFPSGEYTSVALVFNTTTFLVSKSVLYFRKKIKMGTETVAQSPRIEISYSNIQQHPRFEKDTFSEKKYISVLKNGELAIAPAYASYSVINHLKKNK